MPNTLATAEATSRNAFPYFYTFASESTRYQQLFPASQFAAISMTGEYLTAIVFRPDSGDGLGGTRGPFSVTIRDIETRLSTTSKTNETLSITFAENIGPNETVVVPRGPLTLSTAYTGPASGPKDFDIIIPLAKPFFYKPSDGNLLLDIRVFEGIDMPPRYLDAVDIDMPNAAGLGRVNTHPAIGGTVNSPTGLDVEKYGVVARFSTSSVPEPSSTLLVLTGACRLLFRGVRKEFRD